MSKGLRAPLAALLLVGYHTYVAHLFGKLANIKTISYEAFFFLGNADGDLEKAHRLVEHYLKTSPNVSFFFPL